MNRAIIDRASQFFVEAVPSFFNEVICKLTGQQRVEQLLSGIYLQLQQLNEGLQAGGTYFRITPFRCEAGGETVQVVDTDSQGRIREIALAFDSGVGGIDPTIRLSVGGSGLSSGVRLKSGEFNPLGRIPPNTKLFVSSDTAINGYVIEQA
jgi:hypothetical protein